MEDEQVVDEGPPFRVRITVLIEAEVSRFSDWRKLVKYEESMQKSAGAIALYFNAADAAIKVLTDMRSSK